MEHIVPVVEGAGGALAAAGGVGAATQFGKRLADAATDWLTTRLGKSREVAIETARAQGESFVIELEKRVKQLEESGTLAAGDAERAFERPDTIAALRAGYNAATETTDIVKRGVLASIVADRLKAESESIEAVTSRRAIEIASNVSARQFRLLAQLAVVYAVRPKGLAAGRDALWIWLEPHLRRTGELFVSYPDVAYLESLALLKHDDLASSDLAEVLRSPTEAPMDLSILRASPTGIALAKAWEIWKRCSLTLVGNYLGVYALNELDGGERIELWGLR